MRVVEWCTWKAWSVREMRPHFWTVPERWSLVCHCVIIQKMLGLDAMVSYALEVKGNAYVLYDSST